MRNASTKLFTANAPNISLAKARTNKQPANFIMTANSFINIELEAARHFVLFVTNAGH